MLFSDLRELKEILEIDPANTAEDAKLNFLQTQAADLIEECLDRPDLFKKEKTDYYDGTGTQNLILNRRPVFTSPTIQVWVDESGHFGETSGAFTQEGAEKTYGSDFVLDLQGSVDGTSSRSGILVRLDNFWGKQHYRSRGLLSPYIGPSNGSIKVTYTAGYTVDNLPARFRLAANFLISELRYMFPVGMKISSDGYEGRSIGIANSQKDYLLGQIYPMLWTAHNWGF